MKQWSIEAPSRLDLEALRPYGCAAVQIRRPHRAENISRRRWAAGNRAAIERAYGARAGVPSLTLLRLARPIDV
jgi:hypothetical protein